MAFINDEGEVYRKPVGTSTASAPSVPTGAAPTPPPNAVTAPPTVTFGGMTPDYKALLEADPGLAATRNNNARDTAAAAAQRQSFLRSLAIRYGGLPQGFTDKYGDIGADTVDAAKANQFSDLATLHHNYDQGVEQFRRALAARGVLQSGELGYGMDQADRGLGQQEYDLANQFGDAAQGAVNNYLGVELNARNAEAQAIAQAQSAAYQNPENRPTDATTANYDPEASQQYGQPVYKTADGALHNPDGSVFAPPTAPTVTGPIATPAASATPTTGFWPIGGGRFGRDSILGGY